MKKLLLSFAAILLLSCCKEKPDPEPPIQSEVVGVKMVLDHQFDNQTLSLNDAIYATTNNTIGVSVFSYYLSNFEFKRPDGTWHKLDQYELINAHEKIVDTIVFKDLPKGSYTGMRFTLGVDSANNHADPALWPNEHPLGLLRAAAMHWSWNAGYIFLKLEGSYRKDQSPQPGYYSYHIGRSELITQYEFEDVAFNYDEKSVYIPTRFRVKNFFDTPHAHLIADTSFFTHSSIGDQVADILHGNMGDLFEINMP
ncbi:MAG: MbnP family protein [Bacteroidia bacterium]